MPVSGDNIRLVLPAEPIYGHIARIAVTRLALQCGLSRAETEDLRIAVDETLIFLLRPTEDTTASDGSTTEEHAEITVRNHPLDEAITAGSSGVTFTFTIGPEQLVIDATTGEDGAQSPPDDRARRRFSEIVTETVDTLSMDEDGRHVRLEKARRR